MCTFTLYTKHTQSAPNEYKFVRTLFWCGFVLSNIYFYSLAPSNEQHTIFIIINRLSSRKRSHFLRHLAQSIHIILLADDGWNGLHPFIILRWWMRCIKVSERASQMRIRFTNQRMSIKQFIYSDGFGVCVGDFETIFN